MTAESVLFALLRTAVCGEVLSQGTVDACTPEVLSEVYSLTSSHDLAHLAGHALENAKLPNCEILGKFKTAKTQAIYRYMRLDYEYNRVCKTLEKAEIPFVPLKGSVLRNYYPEPWMRTSCDIDILVKEEQLKYAVAEIERTLNYKVGERSNHDISLSSSTGVHLELHYDTIRRLFANDRRKEVLALIWKDAKPISADTCEFVISDEMFYFYHMAHMAKHFENGGCGIRSILDTWVMNHYIEENRAKRETLLDSGGLLAFAQAVESVTEVWFSGETPNTLAKRVGEYILQGGIYGNKENRAAFGQAKAGGKWRYLITRRLFIPYDYLKAEYPILKEHKYLTPIYQIVRWINMLRSGAVKRHLTEIHSIIVTETEIRRSAEQLLRQLGLE